MPLVAHSAYLKIAEGCDRHCTYCIIPKLRGRQHSRPLATLMEEARALIVGGARELTLVAQESTAYGRDMDPPGDLAALLHALAGLDPSVWIRVMYGHPESISPEMIQALAGHDNLCPYLDIPIQHAAAGVLKRMGRGYREQELLRLFDSIRRAVPDVALRTTVLVGFPGESDADFEQLKAFISRVRFDHLGVFAYSDGEDLPSHRLDGHVAPQLAQDRLDELMALQRDISARNLTRYLGRTLDVLIEAREADGYWMGRNAYQAPEVDGVTFVRPPDQAAQLAVGAVVPVRIVETMDYDLTAEVS
jgi:ribosomal protein S12 methylthiotransferase